MATTPAIFKARPTFTEKTIYAHLVEVLQGKNDFRSIDPHFTLLELLSLVQVCEQLAATHVI